MTEKLRTVLVGCGGISSAWMTTAACQQWVEIVGVVDLRVEACAAFCQRWQLPATVVCGSDLAAVLRATKPEAVFDLTIPQAHHRVTCTALAHGCHVLGEKPMAASMEQAREMCAAAEAAQRIYAVTQTRRFNPHFRRLQQFLASGAIGAIHSVHADFFIAAHFGGFRATMPHILLLDMAIHSFDHGRMLTPGVPQRVIAEEWNPPQSNYQQHASAWAAFTMSEGARFTYRGSWTATGAQTSWECGWRILGTRGAVTWDGNSTITAERLVDPDQPSAEDGGPLIRDLEAVPVLALDQGEIRSGHDGAIAAFITAIRSHTQPETECHDTIHSLAMVLGAIASADAGGQPIHLDQL